LSPTKIEAELELEKELAVPKIIEVSPKTITSEAESQTELEKVVEQSIENQSEAPQAATPVPDDQPTEILSKIKEIRNLDQEYQVQTLCDLSFQKGLSYAISVARGLDNPHVLDAFHDTLTGELRQRLIQENKVEEL